jgi:protocatechuate 3,4-dioxygenase beta subunit
VNGEWTKRARVIKFVRSAKLKSKSEYRKITANTIANYRAFFAYSLTAEQYGYDFNSIIDGSLLNDETPGERIYITGSVFDGNGNTISDAMIELMAGRWWGSVYNPISQYPNIKYQL